MLDVVLLRRFFQVVGVLLLLLGGAGVRAQWRVDSGDARTEGRATFTVTGDIMGHQSQIDGAHLGRGRYDYRECFRLIAPYLRASDVSIGNLEVTLGGLPYTGYPRFSSPDTLVDFLQDAGFNVLTTANNHACDRGTRGVIRTVATLERKAMHHTGSYRCPEERSANAPLLLEVNGLRVAVLAYTYATNGLVCNPPAIVDLIDTVQMVQDLQKADSLADATIVCLHWGEEYRAMPTRQQERLKAFLFARGVSVIVGNHPHVIEPIELLRDSSGRTTGLCIYSMGNLVSSQQPFPRAGGLMVHFTLQKDSTGIVIEDMRYLLTYVERYSAGRGKNYRIVPLESPLSIWSANDYARRYVRHATTLLEAASPYVLPIHSIPCALRKPLPAPELCPNKKTH